LLVHLRRGDDVVVVQDEDDVMGEVGDIVEQVSQNRRRMLGRRAACGSTPPGSVAKAGTAA
jgi:hypothetical protein